MTSPNLRLATPLDIPAILRIVRDAYSPYIPRIGREPGPMTDDYVALIQAQQVQVLERDGAIDGLLVLIPEEDALLLDNVAVSPSAQGLGLGRKLLAIAEQTALQKGYTSIRLYTNEAMVENLAIYQRLGYVESHRAEEKGLRRVFMSKAIG
ncbi:GNAT family N-acetyltransferase [Pseudomonas sp. Pseusp122]|uniref:GNAT family N-acetyltransferase n=1 Tax=unclassified Pseudomonas TaxID=196821 RepID=UPI0039A6155B